MFIALSVVIMSMTKSLIKYGKDMPRLVSKEIFFKIFGENLLENLRKELFCSTRGIGKPLRNRKMGTNAYGYPVLAASF